MYFRIIIKLNLVYGRKKGIRETDVEYEERKEGGKEGGKEENNKKAVGD